MKLSCPKDPTHRTFEGQATVSEAWRVDEESNWVETIAQGDVIAEPFEYRCYECAQLGEHVDAVVTP